MAKESHGYGKIVQYRDTVGGNEFHHLIAIYREYERWSGKPSSPERDLKLSRVAELLQINLEELKRQLRAYLQYNPPPVYIPDAPNFSNEIIKYTTDSIAFASCIHAPNYDERKVGEWYKDMYKRRVNNLAIVGDFGDWVWFDQHPKLAMVHEKTISISKGLDIMQGMIDDLLSLITGKLFILTGNHEHKLLRRCDALVSWIHLLKDSRYADRVVMTEYPQMYFKHPSHPSPVQWTKAVHFSQYSTNPFALAENSLKGERVPNEDLSLSSTMMPNLVGGHTHGGWQGVSTNGESKIFILGTFADRNKSSYVWETTRGFPRWNTSYAVYEDGKWDYVTI